MSDFDRLNWVIYRLAARYPLFGAPDEVQATLDLLPPHYRTIYLVFTIDGEVLNGGVSQFFSNSTGILGPEAAAALREIGFARGADVIDEGIALLPKPYPRATRARREAMERIGEIRLEALSDRWNREGLELALIEYARGHGLIPQ